MPKNQLKNDMIILTIIMSALQVVLAKGDDGAIRCGKPRRLESSALARVQQVIHRIHSLYEEVEATLETRTRVVALAEVCECPIHVQLLGQAGIFTLSQLHDADPLLLRHLLEEAEKKNGGIPQYELHGSLKYQTELMSRSVDEKSLPRARYEE